MAAGTGLELFSAVFEPEADSAWLKCLILKFCLVAQSSLHEAGPTLSESKSSVSVTSYTAQHTEASRPETLLAASSSKMPANAKTVSKKQKQKQNARAAALASKQSDSPKSLASKQLHAEKPVLETPNSTDTPMAVPAASEDQSAAVNGFSANPVLDAVPKGTCFSVYFVLMIRTR